MKQAFWDQLNNATYLLYVVIITVMYKKGQNRQTNKQATGKL